MGLIRKPWRKRDGVQQGANEDVGGGAAAGDPALARETAGGAEVWPGGTRITFTNGTTTGAGASTSLTSAQVAAVQAQVMSAYGLTPSQFSAVLAWTPPSVVRGGFSIPAEPEAPPEPLRDMGTLTDYVIGWRAWRPRGVDLLPRGWTFGMPWEPGENTALCLAGTTGHAAPDPGCACGFYIRRSLGNAVMSARDVYGAVRCWGRIIEHGKEGFRVERAEIVALLDPESAMRQRIADVYIVPWDILDPVGADARLPKIAAHYGVPLLNAEDLQRYAYEFGSPLPEADDTGTLEA